MKKTIVNVLVLFVVIVSIFTFINMVSVDRAEAVSCPEGLVCTPVNTAFVCPVGYTCTPAPTCPVGFTCKPKEIQSITCPSGYICKLTNNGGGSSGGNSGGGHSNGCYRFDTNLSVGSFWTQRSTGADVVALQTILMEKGFDVPSVSSKRVAKGVFDADTKVAVIKFQTSMNIPATGFVGPQTRVALNSLCGSTNSPSIIVLSPSSGSSYSVGSKISIRWTFSNFPVPNNPPVDVLLIRKVSGDAHTGVITIAENILGGSYDWTIPASIPNGSSYMITIQTKGQTVNGIEQKGYGSRSGTFSITGSTNFVSASISPANVVAGNSIRVTVDTRNSDVNDKTKNIILSLQSSDGSSYIPSNSIYNKDSQGRWYADYVVPSTAKQGTWVIRQIGLFDDNRVLKYLNYPDDINYVFTVGGSTPAPTPYSTPKPVISYVKPSSNNEARFIGTGYEIYPNDLIDVVGTNLSGKGGIDIYINGRVCKAESLTTEKITCQVPLESIVEGGTYELYARADDDMRSNTILVTVKNRVLSVVPSVKVMSPNNGETWSIGDKKTITWSYANWNSGIFGNKYVDMYLVPMDGRSPIKLATNFNSPDGTVSVTIHEKTSDGRSAWLPGRYKIRVVCNTANVAPFNSCMDESDGYITIFSNPPSPTPIPDSTSVNNGTILNASIWDAIKQYFDSKQQ